MLATAKPKLIGKGHKWILSGAMGITGIKRISTFAIGFGLVLFTLFVVLNIINSKEGLAIKAVRDNRIAAESVGINVTAFRMKAFVVSAILAGMAGALYAMNYGSITASKFNFNTSINILVFVVLGGMGNILGSIISATVLYILPEAMRGLQDYRMIIYAIVLILVMLFTWSPKVKDAVSVAVDQPRFPASSAPTVQARPPSSTCSPASISPPGAVSWSTALISRACRSTRSISWALPVLSRISACLRICPCWTM